MVKAAEQGQGVATRDESERNDQDRIHSLNYRAALATIIKTTFKKKGCEDDVTQL